MLWGDETSVVVEVSPILLTMDTLKRFFFFSTLSEDFVLLLSAQLLLDKIGIETTGSTAGEDAEGGFSLRNGFSSAVRSMLSISDKRLSNSNLSDSACECILPQASFRFEREVENKSEASDGAGEIGRKYCCRRGLVDKMLDATEVVVASRSLGGRNSRLLLIDVVAVSDFGDGEIITGDDFSGVCRLICSSFSFSIFVRWNDLEFTILSYGEDTLKSVIFCPDNLSFSSEDTRNL